ncbi:MAG: hypothetical protein PHP02_06490 [Eubacteriales bacterium]|nr:hypothetical protein [Eubacteriales bacterium]
MPDKYLFPNLLDKKIRDGATKFCHTEKVQEEYFRFCANQCKPSAGLLNFVKRSKAVHEIAVVKALLFAQMILTKKKVGLLLHHHR